MTLTKPETQFLNIAKAAISGTEISTDAVDWPAIFTLSNQQKLLPIIFEAVRQTDAARENPALFAAVKQQVISQVLNQVVRSAEFEDLYKKTLRGRITSCPGKGRAMQSLVSAERSPHQRG